MGDYLNIAGQLITQAVMTSGPVDYQPADIIYLFYNQPDTWTVLTIGRHHRHDRDTDELTEASATVSTSTFGSIEKLAADIRDRYYSSGWDLLLDGDIDYFVHPDLYLAWATRRMEVDFNGSSIYVKDLAYATAVLGGEPRPAPGRALADWEAHHVALMADKLSAAGYEVLDDQTELDAVENPNRDPMLGALRLRRYGHDATAFVRVDHAGEVFVRLHYLDDERPDLAPAPAEDHW